MGTGVLRFAQDDGKNKQRQKQATAKTNNGKNKQRQKQATAKTNNDRTNNGKSKQRQKQATAKKDRDKLATLRKSAARPKHRDLSTARRTRRLYVALVEMTHIFFIAEPGRIGILQWSLRI